MKVIKEFPDYKITESGDIYSIKKKRFLIPNTDKDGYYHIGIFRDHKRYWRRLHRLVAAEFIPNPDNKPQVNHKDGNKQNNHVSNLEWVTSIENSRHAWRTGLIKPPSKEHIQAMKEANSKRVAMCDGAGNILAEFIGTREAARVLGKSFCPKGISKAALGQRKTHAGYTWRYI